MWLYKKNEETLRYEVGFFTPLSGVWICIKDFSTREAAERYINYLNGGSGK